MSHEIPDHSFERKVIESTYLADLLMKTREFGMTAERIVKAVRELIKQDVSIEELKAGWKALNDPELCYELAKATGDRKKELEILYAEMYFETAIRRAIIFAKEEQSKNNT